MTRPNIHIGADPEIFLKDEKGLFVSGHNLIPGTKYDPFPVANGAVQVDGTALEFNIRPAQSADHFVHNITSVLKTLGLMVKKKNPAFKMVFEPTAYYNADYFESLPAYSKALGCEPDMDAYTGKFKKPPETTEPFRTGSGHVHVGWTDDADVTDKSHLEFGKFMVQNLDASLFVMSHAWDDDRKRRELYGQVGSFRPKPYGIEYRVLSNAWLRDEELIRYVYNTTEAVAELSIYGVDLVGTKEAKTVLNELKSGEISKEHLRDYQAFLGSYGVANLPEEYV